MPIEKKGYYRHIYGFETCLQIAYDHKPNWLKRKLVKLILGWYWVDETGDK